MIKGFLEKSFKAFTYHSELDLEGFRIKFGIEIEINTIIRPISGRLMKRRLS